MKWTIQVAYLYQHHLYILLDTKIVQIGLAIAEIQEMANPICQFAISQLCHVRLAILSPKDAYDTQHTLLIHLDTKIIKIGQQMAKLDHVAMSGKPFATLPFFRAEKKNVRNFFLPHQNELENMPNER